MANIAQVQALPAGSAVLTGTTPTAGPDNLIPGDPSAPVYLWVDNASGGSTTITILVPGTTKYGQALPAITGTVAAGAKKVFGPFYNDLQQPDFLIDVTSSATTSVSLYSFRG